MLWYNIPIHNMQFHVKCLKYQSSHFSRRRFRPRQRPKVVQAQPRKISDIPQQTSNVGREYFAQDGKTPIYKIFKRNPYGKR